MKAWLSRLRVQLGGLILLVAGSGLYCLTNGDCSLLTPDQRGHRLFENADYVQAAARFAGEESGNVYSRYTNPTVRMFEQRLAARNESGKALRLSMTAMPWRSRNRSSQRASRPPPWSGCATSRRPPGSRRRS